VLSGVRSHPRVSNLSHLSQFRCDIEYSILIALIKLHILCSSNHCRTSRNRVTCFMMSNGCVRWPAQHSWQLLDSSMSPTMQEANFDPSSALSTSPYTFLGCLKERQPYNFHSTCHRHHHIDRPLAPSISHRRTIYEVLLLASTAFQSQRGRWRTAASRPALIGLSSSKPVPTSTTTTRCHR
jgi:hypothetical protein